MLQKQGALAVASAMAESLCAVSRYIKLFPRPMIHTSKTPAWTWLVPLAGIILFVVATMLGFGEDFASSTSGIAIAVLLLPALIGAVFAAVYHAEDAAHQTGEPIGTLILTIAVTVIELALIVSLIISGKASPTLVRDTVYAVIMLIMTGVVGLCISVGGLRYREQRFDITSTKIYLAVLIVLASLTLLLPNYTMSGPTAQFTEGQLAFVSVVTLALYGVFLFTQTVLHKNYFAGEHVEGAVAPAGKSKRLTMAIALLSLALAAVVVLAKLFSAVLSVAVTAAGAPLAVIGVVVALIVLTPESIAAVGAARRDDLQKSLNLALGSSLATIGLTIPAVAIANIFMHQPMTLGLEQRDTALLITTLAASMLTFGTGRTNVLFGFLHLVLFGTFIFLVFVP